MSVNALLEGSNPYKELSRESAKLAGKWQRSGLLEGIESSTEKNNMSMLLENQAKQLVNESNVTSGGSSFSAGNSEAWAGVALPLVRRVFGEIVAKDLISVQPMNLPAGLIFYLDFQYGSNNIAQSTTDDQHSARKMAGQSLYGATSDMKRTDGAFNTGLYGAGAFSYSTKYVALTSVLDQASNDGSATVLGTPATTEYMTSSYNNMFTDILQSDTEFSASNAGKFDYDTNGEIKVISVLKSVVISFKLTEG